MKYVLFALLVAAHAVVSTFVAAPVHGGFDLIVDETTLRQFNGLWDIDVKIKTNPDSPSSDIYSLLLNLRMLPADGYSEDSLDGISFVGLVNDSPDRLFSSAEVNLRVDTPLIMPGSLVSPVEVSPPAAEKVAFTVRFVSYRPEPTGVRIGFMDVGNFYQKNRIEGPAIYLFDNLVVSPTVSVTGVPEPSTWVLASGAMAAALYRRRRKNLSDRCVK